MPLRNVRDTGRVRVLVVDDEEAGRSALTHALQRDGYEVSTAADGITALATLLRNRHEDVEHDGLMPASQQHGQRGGAVGRRGHLVAVTVQRMSQRAAYGFIVIDHEDPHGVSMAHLP